MTLSVLDQYSPLIENAECDWEDDEHCFTSFEGKGTPEYKVNFDGDVSKVNIIIIADGIIATEFLKQIFNAKIGKIEKVVDQEKCEDLDFLGLHHCAKPITAAELYIQDNVLICCCQSLLAEESSTFASKVTSHFHKVARVIVLTGLPMTSLKSDSDLQDLTVVTRSLNTSRSPKNEAHVLEQPNILTGIAAAFLTHCELKNLAGEVCALYSWYQELDAEISNSFVKYLSSVPDISGLISNSANVKYVPSFNGSNLYM